MNRDGFDAEARRILGDARLRRDAPLAPLTTFKVGGAADWLADVRTTAELGAILHAARASHVPVTLLGGGSNVLVADSGVRGVVIRLHLTGIVQPSESTVRAEAGVTINGLVRWTVGRGLAGLEAWAGTPGTVGGAIHGNAHWKGRNIGDNVQHVTLCSRDGVSTVVAAVDMEFGYDRSRLQRTGEILVSADLQVSPGDVRALREVARASLAFRKRTQPLASPSAGCVFQNPDPAREDVPEGVPMSAGALVDRAGLKGRQIGGARISDTHANFIVNDGTATAADIRSLIELARRTVAVEFGVALRDEVVYLGTFSNG
jgi:UDP-N-acetylmuramate dehydrogenase